MKVISSKTLKRIKHILHDYQDECEKKGWSPKDDCSEFQFLVKKFGVRELE